jgi:endonuclease YncB( thermonuclease family)
MRAQAAGHRGPSSAYQGNEPSSGGIIMSKRDRGLAVVVRQSAFIVIYLGVGTAWAHQHPCHGWHSCPSDRGTYVCGDTGRCDQCPDNQFCLARQPRMETQPPLPVTPPPAGQGLLVEVKRVIDGDTLQLGTGGTVRLIGVDTPETKDPRKPAQAFGKEATAFTQRTVVGQRVRLEYDQQRQDKYGRTLAYVYLENGTFVNAEIIRQGYKFAYVKYPFKYLDQLAFSVKMRNFGR